MNIDQTPNQDTKRLFQELENLYHKAKPLQAFPISLLLPVEKDGYRVEAIAAGVKQLTTSHIDIAVILSPFPEKNLNFRNRGGLVYIGDNIKTPDGNLRNEIAIAKRIASHFSLEETKSLKFFKTGVLPILHLIQKFSPKTKILLIMIGSGELKLAEDISNLLKETIQDIPSSLIALCKLDRKSQSELEFCDFQRFREFASNQLSSTPQPEISFGPILSALKFGLLNQSSHYLDLLNSSWIQATNDAQKISSAVILYRYRPPEISENLKQKLIQLAASSIQEFITNGVFPEYNPADSILEQTAGVFITLREDSNLRGCIGNLHADLPLYKSVQNMSIAAAVSDPRFPPLTLEDLKRISIKISILSPLQRIPIDKIQIGLHGLLIVEGIKRGVLLPEVPLDQGWDLQNFLLHLGYKAGIEPGNLGKKSRLYGFTTVEFSGKF